MLPHVPHGYGPKLATAVVATMYSLEESKLWKVQRAVFWSGDFFLTHCKDTLVCHDILVHHPKWYSFFHNHCYASHPYTERARGGDGFKVFFLMSAFNPTTSRVSFGVVSGNHGYQWSDIIYCLAINPASALEHSNHKIHVRSYQGHGTNRVLVYRGT